MLSSELDEDKLLENSKKLSNQKKGKSRKHKGNVDNKGDFQLLNQEVSNHEGSDNSL